MADETSPGFTNTDLKTIDELAFRLKAADKSAQSINTQLERFIADNYRASQEADKKLSEQNAILRQQQKNSQPSSKEENKPVQPLNVGKEEDLFFEEPVPVLPEPVSEPVTVQPQTQIQTQPQPLPVIQEPPQLAAQAIEPIKDDSAIKDLAASVTNVENNTYSVMPTTVEKIEKVIEPGEQPEPKIIKAPVPEPQIIEKTVPVVNTVNTVEKTLEQAPVQSEALPPVIEKPAEPTKAESPELPTRQQSPQIPVVLPQQPSPTVNVNVTEAAPTVAPTIPEVSIPPVATASSEPVLKEPTPGPSPLQSNIPEISAPLPQPVIPEFTAAVTPPATELPPVITEPETKKPEVGLNLTDESLVGLNKGLEKIATLLAQNHSKLIASIEALNGSVGEILKMLPSLQSTSSEQQSRANPASKQHKIDSSSMISNYRQSLGLTTKGFTNNTVFPGGNSIS